MCMASESALADLVIACVFVLGRSTRKASGEVVMQLKLGGGGVE